MASQSPLSRGSGSFLGLGARVPDGHCLLCFCVLLQVVKMMKVGSRCGSGSQAKSRPCALGGVGEVGGACDFQRPCRAALTGERSSIRWRALSWVTRPCDGEPTVVSAPWKEAGTSRSHRGVSLCGPRAGCPEGGAQPVFSCLLLSQCTQSHCSSG